MNNKFTIDQLSKSESIDPNSINRLYEINKMLDFTGIRSNNPRMTQKQICNQLGTSDSTIKRYRYDINMDSSYNTNNYKKKKHKKSPDITTENNKSIEKRLKNRFKNEIKGGKSSDIHTIRGKQLIEQAFNTTIND